MSFINMMICIFIIYLFDALDVNSLLLTLDKVFKPKKNMFKHPKNPRIILERCVITRYTQNRISVAREIIYGGFQNFGPV